ncbi:MAG: glutamate--tRNA ligase [Rhodospirillales bacterium]|nr:glutamate--tRNA ligase [Rhodospirillales bacterium]
MTVVTRFAPSPTGFLHIGGARTALFNWLYAHSRGGRFLLRIEDTDRARSTDAAINAIIDGLRWLGLDWSGDPTMQSERAARHAAVAHDLLARGRAYRCWASTEELTEMRQQAKAQGLPFRYDGRWRDRDPAEAPTGVAPVIRLRAPASGETRIADLVQGDVTVANAQLDDMVLLRSDGTPTYMLAVVVDDHDMGITHVIRGDDHLSNAFRQYQLYRALDWPVPEFAHVPLIHGADGAKLSKRHGALGVDAYRDMGYLPEALCNYLLRLGWSHGDDEIIDREQAIAWFDLPAIGRSPSRFDFAKLDSLNAHYLRRADLERLATLVVAGLGERGHQPLSPAAMARLRAGLPGLRDRAKTVRELADNAGYYIDDGVAPLNAKAREILKGPVLDRLRRLCPLLESCSDWTAGGLEQAVRHFVAAEDPPLALGKLAQPLRAALTGTTVSPPIFDVMAALGRELTLRRITHVLKDEMDTETVSTGAGG